MKTSPRKDRKKVFCSLNSLVESSKRDDKFVSAAMAHSVYKFASYYIILFGLHLYHIFVYIKRLSFR